jgi:metal-responsive CopG/Arc/MetJ family transcriptional regulator
MTEILVPLDEETLARLDALCARHGVSRDDLLHALIRAGLEHPEALVALAAPTPDDFSA